ncbi:urease accessory protein UreD [Dichotomocladium elegans]|nr:urease accessory protein UreD [Dichotomocladium elegans]
MLFPTAASNVPGTGIITCQCHDRKAQLSRLHAQYPLKFIPTQAHVDRLAVVYMLSYGGGIVSGDRFDVTVHVESRAMLLLMTQGNTKIFRDPEQQPRTAGHPSSEQVIQFHVAPDATLLVLPDPVTAFRFASFASKQTFHLASATSQLILLDWFTSGRLSRGESWTFQHYASKIDVFVDGKLVLRDHMVLQDTKDNNNQMTTSYAAQLRTYTCFATLIIIGADASLASNIGKMAAGQRIMASASQQRPLLWSSSQFLKGRATLVRVAGRSTEQVRNFVKNKCLGQNLRDIVGDGMFAKILV